MAGLRCVGAFSRTKRNRVRKGTAVLISRCDCREATGSRMDATKEVFQITGFPGNGLVVDPTKHATSGSISENSKSKKRSTVNRTQRSA